MKRQKDSQGKRGSRPIGIFDSGVGGLTVVKEIRKRLPNENIIYFGDTARVPYGTKSKETVVRFSIKNALFLLKYNVKLIVVACNTSSSVALPTLRRNFKVPIIGVIKPGAKDASQSTKNKRIGVIGTSTTIRSNAYKNEVLRNIPSVKVFTQSCPLFVPLAEEGWFDKKITLDIIREYILPIKTKAIDTLILGCTHYPLLRRGIKKVAGKGINLIDSAVSTAKAVDELLNREEIANKGRLKGKERFFVSDEPERFKIIGEKFLGKKLPKVRKV